MFFTEGLLGVKKRPLSYFKDVLFFCARCPPCPWKKLLSSAIFSGEGLLNQEMPSLLVNYETCLKVL